MTDTVRRCHHAHTAGHANAAAKTAINSTPARTEWSVAATSAANHAAAASTTSPATNTDAAMAAPTHSPWCAGLA